MKTMKSMTALAALILVLGACSGDDPVAPRAGNEGGAPAEGEKRRDGMPIQRWENANFHGLGLATYANARMAARAARRFAADNDGIPPSHLPEVNAAGRSFQDYLPGGRLLWNPFTGKRSNPITDVHPCCAGVIGYLPVIGPEGVNVGFVVIARGTTVPNQEFTIEWYAEGYGPGATRDATPAR